MIGAAGRETAELWEFRLTRVGDGWRYIPNDPRVGATVLAMMDDAQVAAMNSWLPGEGGLKVDWSMHRESLNCHLLRLDTGEWIEIAPNGGLAGEGMVDFIPLEKEG